ncbi:MAG: alanine racemase [Proteobacteria bacterium]|nr:alanine racemase [Pseudomonadota bacterium]
MVRTCHVLDRYDHLMMQLQNHPKFSAVKRVVVVTKYAHMAAVKTLAQERSHCHFAENRLEGLKEKKSALKNYPISWIYLGALQSRKIKQIVSLADEIHSVASLGQLRHIAREATKQNKVINVYLQVHLAEPQKNGFVISDHPLSWLANCHHDHNQVVSSDTLVDDHEDKMLWRQESAPVRSAVKILGLMAMPPLSHSRHYKLTSLIPTSYYHIVSLGRGYGFQEISLGMSEDWSAGLTAGATEIRIGRSIFQREL